MVEPSGSAVPTLGALAAGKTLLIIGQTFRQEYLEFIEGTGLTPAGSSHYATLYWGAIEQGDDGPNAEFLKYVDNNDLGDYALVALSIKDNTPAGGYGQMVNPNAPDYNSNAIWDALDDIRNGLWDSQIDSFAQTFASHPDTRFLLRIGYEVSVPLFAYKGDQYVGDWFSQMASAGINVTDNPDNYPELDRSAYIDAYNHIAERIRAQAANVEFGFHPVRGLNDTKWLYPGPENVDWVGFSVFNNDLGMDVNGVSNAPGQRIDPNLALAMDFARAAGHKIVIAEAAAQNPAASDPSQFVEYLTRLHEVVERYDVAALAYINSNWSAHGWGSEWGDSRVETRPAVEAFYLNTFGAGSRYVYSGTATQPPAPQPPSEPGAVAAAADRAFWETLRGVGFSVGSLGALGGQARMEAALQEVADLGFTVIRTWGTDEYTGRILEAITRLELPLKVQPGIWITQDAGAREQIDAALAIITPYADKVVGVSLGNEQVVDWNTWSPLTVPELLGQVQYFKSRSSLPVTYNFAGETFLPGASQWGQNLAGLLQELDYVNVHSYGGFFDNRTNPAWTPQLQLASVQVFESMLASRMDSLGLGSKPLILGETGWQSSGYNPAITNPANQQEYYELISRYVYGPEARFDGMFYFNFTDETWKGGDDNWGLFREGTPNAIGTAKFAIVSVPDVLAGVPNPAPPAPDPAPPAVFGSFPVSIVNNTGGAYADNQIFVTIFGQTTPGNWAWVDATGQTHQLDHTAASAPGHLVKDGRNFADMSFTVAEAGDLHIPPRLDGARIYFSLGEPLYIGISPDNSGWAGPDPMNPTDPNINTVYDWYEMTYEYGRVPFGGNTTQVDLFGFPFTFTLTQTSTGYSGTRGITLTRDEVFQRFADTVPAPFQALVVKDGDGNPLRVLAPRSQQPGELATWFDEPVNAFWAKYAAEPFVYNGPGFSVTGGVDSSNRLAYTVTNHSNGTSTSHTMTKPTTADVWRADGPFIGTGLQGAFLAHLDASFHRGVATSPQNWDNAASYYPAGGRWNNWAQFFHANSIGGFAYGFPYDDVNNQSPVLILTNTQPLSGLTIVIGS